MLGLSEVAQFLLKGVELFRGIVNGVLDLANGFLSVAEAFTNGILDAIGAIVDALANAVVVEYFCVYGTLRPVESVCVGCKARILLLGQPIQWDGELCLDLSFFGAVGNKAAVTHTPDIAKIGEKTQEFESEGNKIDEEVESMEREEAKQDGEVNAKTNEDVDTNFRAKRSHVPTEEEAYFYRAAYDRIPDVNIRSFETEKSVSEGSPWILAKDWTPAKRQLEIDPNGMKKRILNIDEKDHCKLMENVYSNYNNIAEGFGTFLKNAEKQKAGFNAMKRSYLAGIDYVKNIFDEGDKRHNITDEEREHVKYWYDYLDKGLTEHIKKSEELLHAQRKTYIPDFRKQVSELISKETQSTLPEFVTKMKDAVLQTYEKRSEIPKPTLERQATKWEKLHQTFQEIASNEAASYHDLSLQVASANQLLADMKRSEIPCAT